MNINRKIWKNLIYLNYEITSTKSWQYPKTNKEILFKK